MKKTTVVLSVGLMLMLLAFGPVGIGQMNHSTNANSQTIVTTQQEIHLLKALNQAGLSVDQLMQLQTIIADIRSAQNTLIQPQQQLKDFLLSWQGNSGEFEAALKPYEDAIQQVQQLFSEKRQTAIAQFKDLVSFRQGELFLKGMNQSANHHLSSMGMGMNSGMEQMKNAMGMQVMMGHMQQHMQQPQEHMSRMMQQMQTPQQTRGMMSQGNWETFLSQNLELLAQVISDKTAAIQGN